MDDFHVEVVGAKPERQAKSLLTRPGQMILSLASAVLMRPPVLVLIGLALFVLSFGTPHVGWDYQCRHRVRLGQPCKAAVYCAYYGIQGRRVVRPANDEGCKVATFLSVDWQQIF